MIACMYRCGLRISQRGVRVLSNGACRIAKLTDKHKKNSGSKFHCWYVLCAIFYVIRVPAYAKKGTLVPGGGGGRTPWMRA